MRIRWENIFAVGLLVFLIVLLVRWGRPVQALVKEAFDPPAWEPRNQVVSLMVFGLIVILIVALVRIVISRKE